MENKIEDLEYLKSIFKNVMKKEIDTMKKEIIEEFQNKSLDSHIINQFEVKNLSNDIIETIDKEKFKSLKDCGETTEIPCTLLLSKNSFDEDLIYNFNIDSHTYKVILLLTNEKTKEFLKNFKNKKKIWCKGILRYSDILDIYSLSNIEIFSIIDPLQEYIKIFKGKSLEERINTLTNILGLNPDTLTLFEKTTVITRLIPLVEKKYLFVDISKKSTGKSHIYSKLGLNLHTLNLTRANVFIDARTSKSGSFLSEDIAFIVDEIHKVNDPEFFNAIQVYMNELPNDPDIGSFQSSLTSSTSSNSIILLGNIDNDTPYSLLYKKNKSIFENTPIPNNKTGAAFISRISGILPSWGCREFSDEMKNKINDFYSLNVLQESIPILREIKLDIQSCLLSINKDYFIYEIHSEKRQQTGIMKSFEGFIKLLYPELIDNFSILENIKNELKFLLLKSLELIMGIDYHISLLEHKNFNLLIDVGSNIRAFSLDKYKNLGEENLFFATPHRLFLVNSQNNSITKIPLDFIGIQMNRDEFEQLKEKPTLIIGFDKNNILTHKNLYVNIQAFYSFCPNYNIEYNYLTSKKEILNYSANSLRGLAINNFYREENFN